MHAFVVPLWMYVLLAVFAAGALFCCSMTWRARAMNSRSFGFMCLGSALTIAPTLVWAFVVAVLSGWL